MAKWGRWPLVCLHATLKSWHPCHTSFSLYIHRPPTMHITALTLSPSASSLRPKIFLHGNSNPRLVPVQLHLFTSSCGLSCHRSSSLCSPRLSVHSPTFSGFKFRASPIPENADETEKSSNFGGILQLGSMFLVWYLLNIYFNIFNKQVRLLCLYWFRQNCAGLVKCPSVS